MPKLVSTNILIEMTRKGISKKDLTALLNENGVNVTYSTVCKWLNGTNDPSFRNLGIIAKILGKKMPALFEDVE